MNTTLTPCPAASAPVIEEAASLLRAAGWIVMPPAMESIPEPRAGATWVSSKASVEPRNITMVDPGMWGCGGLRYVTPKGRKGSCTLYSWKNWARKTGARPTGEL